MNLQLLTKAAERGYVDAVIDPRNSRPVVINALKMLASKHEVHPAKKHGNISAVIYVYTLIIFERMGLDE